MDSKLQMFQNKEFGTIRVVEIDGQPWFVGRDVAIVLGYSDTFGALKKHVDDEDRQNCRNDSFESNRGMVVINESGLYSLILSSKLPTAKSFKRWVTSEVLPSIRKHGAYMTDELLREVMRSQDAAFELFDRLRAEMDKTSALREYVGELKPKARYYDIILQNKGAVQVSIIAKDYGMSAVSFNRLLHDAGVQYKSGKTWLLYQKYAGQGYTMSRTYPINDYAVAIHTYWTQKGRLFLYELLKEYGMLPQMEIHNAAACY